MCRHTHTHTLVHKSCALGLEPCSPRSAAMLLSQPPLSRIGVKHRAADQCRCIRNKRPIPQPWQRHRRRQHGTGGVQRHRGSNTNGGDSARASTPCNAARSHPRRVQQSWQDGQVQHTAGCICHRKAVSLQQWVHAECCYKRTPQGKLRLRISKQQQRQQREQNGFFMHLRRETDALSGEERCAKFVSSQPGG